MGLLRIGRDCAKKLIATGEIKSDWIIKDGIQSYLSRQTTTNPESPPLP